MEPEELMAALDDFAKFVETATGMRQQLLDQDWSKAEAERIVVHILTRPAGAD